MNRHLALLLLLLVSAAAASTERVMVGEFSDGRLEGWHERSFQGHTRYRLVEQQGRTVLHAHSEASASGLYREMRIDLHQTPHLHWSWRVDHLLQGHDERQRDGDDYPARLYVVFPGGVRFWRTRAVNYVWSSQQTVDSAWPNAFTANARMIAIDAGDERLGEWRHHRRNVLEDYRRLFGEEPGRAGAVAIMTDSDNTGQQAEAWYGDIWFSKTGISPPKRRDTER